MKKNLGVTDRIIRLIAAVLLAALYFSGTFTGILAIVLVVLSITLVATSLISFCPLYLPFGLNTVEKKANENEASKPNL
jgi:hypothetical protein